TMGNYISRRRFLQTTAAAGALTFWSGRSSATENKVSANERVQVGVIGVAGQGQYDLNEVAKAGAAIVALCDVDENRAGTARKRFPEAQYYPDFRHLLDQKGLDAVVIATPDHTHAVATVAALKAGLHVYCEKPLTHTVHEARVVAETAAQQKRVTQLGTQIHAGNNYRRVVELLQSGAIGAVKEVHVWVDVVNTADGRPTDTPPVPSYLHYDLWLGPAPFRPYHPAYLPKTWRHWWDFGGGTLEDFGCHHIDLSYWALNLRYPLSVETEGPQVHPEATCPWM